MKVLHCNSRAHSLFGLDTWVNTRLKAARVIQFWNENKSFERRTFCRPTDWSRPLLAYLAVAMAPEFERAFAR
jgi:hypothetical protein